MTNLVFKSIHVQQHFFLEVCVSFVACTRWYVWEPTKHQEYFIYPELSQTHTKSVKPHGTRNHPIELHGTWWHTASFVKGICFWVL